MITLAQQRLSPTILDHLNYPRIRRRLFLKLDPIRVTQRFELTDLGKKLPDKIYYHDEFIKSSRFLELYREPGIFYRKTINLINETSLHCQFKSLAKISGAHIKGKRSLSFEVQAPDYNLASDCVEHYFLGSEPSSGYFWESLEIDYIRLHQALRSLHDNGVVMANIRTKTIGFYLNQISFFDYSRALRVPKGFTFGRKADRYYLAAAFVEYLVKKEGACVSISDPAAMRDTFSGFMNRQKDSKSKLDFQNRILLGLSEFHSRADLKQVAQ